MLISSHAYTLSLPLSRIHMHICIHARTHAHTHARTHARTHAHTHTHTLTDIHTYTHTHTHTHSHTHTHLHTHTHTYTHTTHAHTHTHTLSLSLSLQIHALLVMGWYNEKKMTDQYSEEKRWVFSFDLREWKRMPDNEKKESSRSQVLCIERISPTGSVLPILGTQKIRISEAERREREGE